MPTIRCTRRGDAQRRGLPLPELDRAVLGGVLVDPAARDTKHVRSFGDREQRWQRVQVSGRCHVDLGA